MFVLQEDLVEQTSVRLTPMISMLFFSFFFRLSFLGAVANSTSQSQLKTIRIFPAIEKWLYLWSKISGLLLYRKVEHGIEGRLSLNKNFSSLAPPAVGSPGLRMNKSDTLP